MKGISYRGNVPPHIADKGYEIADALHGDTLRNHRERNALAFMLGWAYATGQADDIIMPVRPQPPVKSASTTDEATLTQDQ